MKKFIPILLFISLFFTSAPSIALPGLPAWQKIQECASSAFSYDNQKIAINLYLWSEILIQLPSIISVLTSKSKPLNPLPEEIETAVKKMGMQNKGIKFYQESTKNIGFATALGNITTDPEFYDKATREERLMVIGHELTHIRDRHHLKGAVAALLLHPLANLVTAAGSEILDASFAQATQSKFLQKYPKFLGALEIIKDASKVTLESPLFNFFFVEGLKALQSRMHEKSADITSAQTLGCAEGGISVFNSFIEHEKNRSWLSCLHPRYLFFTLQEKLGLATHPEDTERIKYLSELLNKQTAFAPALA